MRTLALLALLALVTLSHQAPDGPGSAADPPGSPAFVSRRASAELLPRAPRSVAAGSAAAPPGPLEAQREVCELSAACDELADQIGFAAAYERFYGTAPQ